MRIFVAYFLVALFAGSCNQIYKEYDKESFTTLSWKRGQTIKFYPEIEDTSKRYALEFGLRHMYGARIKSMRITVTVVSPSGHEDTKEYAFDVMNDKDEYLASCAGNMCDIETIVDDNFRFSETGTYTFILSQSSDQENIRGIMEFGLIIGEK
jgi:gliding motility-associated lipoprotein GldH